MNTNIYRSMLVNTIMCSKCCW